MNTTAKPVPKSKVTTALVMRVVERVENGIPVKIAIAGEGMEGIDLRKCKREVADPSRN